MLKTQTTADIHLQVFIDSGTISNFTETFIAHIYDLPTQSIQPQQEMKLFMTSCFIPDVSQNTMKLYKSSSTIIHQSPSLCKYLLFR